MSWQPGIVMHNGKPLMDRGQAREPRGRALLWLQVDLGLEAERELSELRSKPLTLNDWRKVKGLQHLVEVGKQSRLTARSRRRLK